MHRPRWAVSLASLFLAAALGAACGRSHPVCPSETHRADPDGRGERCVDDRSTCDAPSDCVSADACCTSSCEDADGSGVYACVEACRSPECSDGTCDPGWVCQAGIDECAAYCVPDNLPCDEGWILGDPSGTGVWECIRADSTCSRRQDCPDGQNGCCLGACTDQGGGQYACTQDCGGGAADEARMWECTTDQECENMMGQPGWTCVPTACDGNECQPPVPECVSDADCVLAIDVSQCCAECPSAYARNELAGNECLMEWSAGNGDAEPGAPAPPADPPVCEPNCTDVACPAIECMPAEGASCLEGQCVPVY